MSLSAARRDDLKRVGLVLIAVICLVLIMLAGINGWADRPADDSSSTTMTERLGPLPSPAKLKQMEAEFSLGCGFADTDVSTAVLCNSGLPPEQVATP